MSEENREYDRIKKVNITDEVKSSFLDYAMSVIVARALPDAKDGLKPVQRRIMYGMNDMGVYADHPYKKSARITGEVMGKYHPHGDSSIYEALVRMAQDFSYRYLLVDGQGNFGSIDGDGQAAQRYTEARMSKISMELLRDIKKDTIDFQDNYDGEEQEPVVLPAHFPNLLVNGSTGIAVGMATNFPPHNLGETIDAIIATIENPEISVVELMENYIQGPDFPTGAQVLGRSGIRNAFETGRGSIIIRSKAEIEKIDNGRQRIVITEIPYMTNKATLVAKMAELVKDKIIEGVTDLRDESSREGLRIVVDLRKDAQGEVILNQFYHLSPLQTTYGINMLALVDNAPKVLSLKECINVYVDHQIDVTQRRVKFDLRKAEDRDHILQGLLIALDDIDAVINIIRNSANDDIAMSRLMNEFALSEIQAKAIMDMQLRRLTGLQRSKIEAEHNELVEMIADFKDILANHSRVLDIIKTDLLEIKERFGDERRTEIVEAGFDVEDEDLIPEENVIITITTNGYIKRNTTDTYRTQNRGGKGVKGISMHDDDIVSQVVTMSTHNHLLLFTNFGKVYRIKGYQVPQVNRTAKGTPIVNILTTLDKDEKIRSMVPIDPNADSKYLFFVTAKGLVKKVEQQEFDSIRQTGKIAITLREDDELFAVKQIGEGDEIVIAGSNGKAIRFMESDVRPMGRNASGVIGFNTDGSEVVGVTCRYEGEYLLAVTEKGYGKKTALDDYRLTQRGAKGVGTINITDKNGKLVSVKAVNGDEDLLIATTGGVVIRISLSNVSVYGRNTQGVRLINVEEGSTVSTIAVVEHDETEETIAVEIPMEETTEEQA